MKNLILIVNNSTEIHEILNIQVPLINIILDKLIEHWTHDQQVLGSIPDMDHL